MQALNWIDWLVLAGTLITIVAYGTWKTKGSKNVQDYVRGGNEAKWWTIGLSVMATQASAITFLSTPGQAFHDGMGFVQFYFGLPLAMIIICIVFIPLYDRLKVYTAYEFLESRFDIKTRKLTAILFLIQRGLGAGITIYAPAIVLSYILNWDLMALNIAIGVLVIIYTASGGTKAVSVTQKHQMAVIFTGMFIAFFLIIYHLPEGINFKNALEIAGVSNKMNILDPSFSLEKRYTIWSGLIGGTFLMLSYFGTDQSQVQRYLSGRSIKEMRMGLIFNAILKVPMQFFILLVGVMVFVFYQFNASPVNFNPQAKDLVDTSQNAVAYQEIQQEYDKIVDDKRDKVMQFATSDNLTRTEENQLISQIQFLDAVQGKLREDARDLIEQSAMEKNEKVETNDKDYVFIHFVLNNLPRGLIGLLLAVILSAAMSSTASELNALGSTTTLDIYKNDSTRGLNDMELVKTSKWFTVLWGVLAIIIACIASLFDNLIQLVNTIGSLFYGNVLGIFLLAFFFKRIKGNHVFMAAVVTQIFILLFYYFAIFQFEQAGGKPVVSYLWLNFMGCILVIFISLLSSIRKLDGASVLTLIFLTMNIVKVVYDIFQTSNTNILFLLSIILLVAILGWLNSYEEQTST